MPNVDGTNWDEASPANTDDIAPGALEVRSLRVATKVRFAKEHVTPAASSVGGEHVQGSARLWSNTSDRTKKIDGTTNLDADDLGRGAIRTDLKVLKYWDGSAWQYVRSSPAVAILREQQNDGVDGGTFTTGSWQQRVLNSELSDLDGIVSISAGDFSLVAGTYKITAWACGYKCGTHRLRMLNVTDANSVTGLPATSDSTDTVQTIATVVSIHTITGTKTFRLQHQCTSTRGSDGLGQHAGFGTTEVYSQVEIERILR